MSTFSIKHRQDIDDLMADNNKLFTSSFENKIQYFDSNIMFSIMVRDAAKNQNKGDIELISNMLGSINLIQIDLLIIVYYTLNESRTLPKIYLARQAALLIYEALITLMKYRNSFYKTLNKHEFDIDFIHELKTKSVENKDKLVMFENRVKKSIEDIRHFTAAHRDFDFENQINAIKGADPNTMIGLSMEFDSIVQELSDILKSYLDRYVIVN